MRVDPEVRSGVDSLLRSVTQTPCRLPLTEIVGLSGRPWSIRVDRSDAGTTVWVAPRPDRCFDVLSDREREVAALMADGLSNRQIAERLFISLATTKDHVHAVLRKTGRRSRSAVAAAWHGPGAQEG